MFAQSMTEEEVNKHGAASELRHFHTTYGQTFGYNERARKYHRSYGLVTPPTNPAFHEYRLGDLATAPLFRRDHLGFRIDYPNEQFTWSQSANKLKKNQKHYGDEEPSTMTSPSSSSLSPSAASSSSPLPKRRVEFHPTLDRPAPIAAPASPLYDPRELAASEDEFRRHSAARAAAFERTQRERAVYEADAAEPRAVLTSSLSHDRPTSLSATGRNPLLQPNDYLNRNLYPRPGYKTSDINPAFDAPR